MISNIRILLLAFSFTALFLPPAQAGLVDSIRGAIDSVRGVGGKSNLTVSITSAQVRGESLYVNYTVENNGSADTTWGVPVELDIYVNNEKVAQDSLPQLREGALSRQSKTVTPRVWQKVNNIKIKVDPYNRIDEASERDNEDADSVEKDVFTDLYIKGISFSKSPVTEGDKAAVNVEVENKGNTAAMSPKVEVIFNDKESKVTFPYKIDANSSETIKVEFSADIPLIKIGRNKIGAWIEPATAYQSVEKLPLADHDAAYLDVEAKPKPKPNFVIYGAVNPKDIEQAGEISIWFNIFNKGPRNDPDSEPTTAVLYVNNERIKEFSVKALSPWIESAEFTHKYNLEKAGKYEIRVVVDENNSIEEIKEDDNTYVYGTALDEFIDLEVGDIGIQNNTTLKEDGYVTVTPAVGNKGTVRADCLVSVYLDRKKVWGETFRIDPNSSLSASREVKVYVKGEGNHALTAEAVPYSHHENLERNKNNNKKDYNILILPPALPILKPDMVDYGPVRLYLGEQVKMSFRVDNAGEGGSPQTYVRMLVNDKVEQDFRLEALMPGANQQFKYAITPDKIGQYEVKIMVNPQGADIRRGNVKYNHTGFTVDVLEVLKPHLTLEFTDYGPAVLYTGEKIKASFRVANNGNAASPSVTFVRMLINGRVEKDFTAGSIAAGGYQPFSYEKEINEAGSCEVEVRINPEGEDARRSGVKYDKIGFSSDVKEKPKVIDPAVEKFVEEAEFIDLAVDDLQVSPPSPKKGDQITIKFSVGNLGNKEARGAAVIEYNGRQIHVESVYLAPQAFIGSKIVEKKFTVEEAGTFNIKTFAAPNTSYKDLEKNEDNNTKEQRIIVTETDFMDLGIGKIGIARVSPEKGEILPKDGVYNLNVDDLVVFAAQVRNDGSVTDSINVKVNFGSEEYADTRQMPANSVVSFGQRFRVKDRGEFTVKIEVAPSSDKKNLEKDMENNYKEIRVNAGGGEDEMPVITSFSAKEAGAGQAVIIYGKNLYLKYSGELKVKFQGAETTYIGMFSDGEKLNVVVPQGAKSGKVTVVKNGKESNALDFTVIELKPTIDMITPNEALPGNTIQVNGQNLIRNVKERTAKFQGAQTQDINVFREYALLVKVPEGVKSGKFSLVIDGKESNSVDFKLKEIVPVIERIEPEEAEPGTMVVLYGKNLYGTGSDIVAYFEGGESTNLGRFTDGTKLNVGIPAGARSGKLYVIIDGKKSSEVNIAIKSRAKQQEEVHLEMRSVSLSNYTPKEKDSVAVTAVIVNRQDIAVDGVKWEFSMDGRDRELYDAGSIGAGAEKVLKTAFLAKSAGRCKIAVKVIPPQGKINMLPMFQTYRECDVIISGEEPTGVDLAIQKLDISINKPPFTVLRGDIVLTDGEEIMIDGIAINLGEGESRFEMEMKLDDEIIMSSMSPGTAVPNQEIDFSITAKVEGLGVHIVKAVIMPTSEYRSFEENGDNNTKEVRITVKEGVAAGDFSEVKSAVNNLYSEFKSSYSNVDVNGVLRCIDKEWESSGGQSFYDLSSRLSNIFSTFTQLRVEMSGFSVSPSEDPDYAARVDYFIKIDGALFYNPSIKHHEEGQVTEYIKRVKDKYFIGKTEGKGAF